MHGMMQNIAMGPTWGIILVVAIGGIITIACYAVMLKFILRPGEQDRNHPKYEILRRDR